MTDTKPEGKLSLIDRLRKFLDELGADEAEAVEAAPDEIAATTEDEEAAAEIDAAEAETESEVEGDEPTEPGDGDGTPSASDEPSAEDDDLRAQITEQAAIIETLRNTVAELGGEDPTQTDAADEAELDAEDDRSESEVVADFDADYDRRKAILADLDKES